MSPDSRPHSLGLLATGTRYTLNAGTATTAGSATP